MLRLYLYSRLPLLLVAPLGGMCLSIYAEASCEQISARLVTLQGALDIQQRGSGEWNLVNPERDFCNGDRIHTRLQSRATVELKNKTVISLDQQTTVVFSNLKARSPSWLDLLKGVMYVRSRTPTSLDVRTHYVNAAIRGTEFLVSADDNQGQITVLEGTVESSNDQGSITVTNGQTAVAKQGQAPVRKLLVSPKDAVQWALYYPPIIDLPSLRQKASDPAVKQALSRYLDGDSLAALAILDSAGNPDKILRAGLLTGMGRVEEARPLLEGIGKTDPRLAEVLALRAMVALAQNDKTKAIELAQQSTMLKPQLPMGWTALSYAWQADFQLDAALHAADQSAALDPDNALARAREAELLSSLGRRAEAREAAEAAARINPRLARAWAVLGYAQLTEMDYAEAAKTFRKAIDLDNADPLSRFGLGLAKIRAGDLEGGTADLEIATNLDPNNSLSRSYLGKAYYEQKNSKVADTEFELAKQLDPNDPTPWFYGAIKKQTENRPVEAVKDMRKAIELNGNRAVYRSKLLLDDDLAARGSALGRIYNQLGFQRLGQLEAFNSLETDPSNYTAHRLLSDSYLNVQRQDVARVSSLLQSQMLQPINITPLQPQQAESNLLTVSGLGPTDPSMNEFNPLFARNQVSLLPSATVGSFNTYSNETVLSGIYNNLSGSLGQMHFATSGFRKNNDIDQNIYSAFIQAQVMPDFKIMSEYRHRDTENGYLPLIFSPTASDLVYINSFRERDTTDSYRLGSHWSPTSSSDLLTSLAYSNDDIKASYTQGAFKRNFVTQVYSAETQYIYRHTLFDSVTGVSAMVTNGQYNGLVDNILQKTPSDTQYIRATDGYIYVHTRYPDRMMWTLGMGINSLKYDVFKMNSTQIFPKLGLTWQLFDNTALRFGYFRNQRQNNIGSQTLEPVQIAGFNQFYDDNWFTNYTRYGFALDQHINSQLSTGLEISQRNLSVPTLDANYQPNHFQWREQNYHGYVYWMPIDRISISLDYNYEDFFNRDYNIAYYAPSTRTHTLPLTLSYFDPTGWFAQIKTTYVKQQVFVNNTSNITGAYQQDSFALVDTSIGFRLPKRLGIIQFDIHNLFNQGFNYQSNNLRFQTIEQAPFFPSRSFYGRITLSF